MITLKAPAKINWFLHVVRKRSDGYHDIVSLMQCVGLYDSLVMDFSGTVEVFTEAGIRMEENLVYKAAVLLKEETGTKSGARIILEKETPMAAGLGGGSSDAASTMIGLNRLWDLDMNQRELAALGEKLGSDVPFFFHGPAAVIEGKGEMVSPVQIERSYAILLVKPPVGVSTAWGYAEMDKLSRRGPASQEEELTKKGNNIKLFCHALESGDFSLLSSFQENEFEPLLIRKYPVIGDIKRKLLMKGALFSAMSGSGPTVFGVFESERKAAEAVDDVLPNWCRVVKTVTLDE
jgi:4-diphosphocytidyl-2-C-methyl-D-erythritol kinase